MHFRILALVALFVTAFPALSQVELPARLDGMWTNPITHLRGKITIELVKMETVDRAQVKLSMTNARGGTEYSFFLCHFGPVEVVAERRDGLWQIATLRQRCAAYVITFSTNEATKRFEGKFTNDMGGEGPIVFD